MWSCSEEQSGTLFITCSLLKIKRIIILELFLLILQHYDFIENTKLEGFFSFFNFDLFYIKGQIVTFTRINRQKLN